MLKKIVLLCWVSILLPVIIVKAQQKGVTLSGHVVDKATKKGIPGATVVLLKTADTLRVKWTAVKTAGDFILNEVKAGTYIIKVMGIGYKTFISNPFKVDGLSIRLPAFLIVADDKHHLAEVTIVTRKAFTEQKIDRLVVNVGNLISNSGASAADALNQSPGVELTDDGVNLRGREGVVVMIDDKPTHFSGKELVSYLKTLPANMLDKIEIIPIPPARYTAGGTAGVINIKTRKNTSQGFNSSVTVNYSQGQRAKTNSNINFNYKSGNLNIFGNGGYALDNSYYSVKWNRNYETPSPLLSPVIQQQNFETSTTQNINYRIGFDYDVNNNTTLGILLNGFTVPYTEHGNYKIYFNALNGEADSSILVKSELGQHSNNTALNFNLRHQFTKPTRQVNINIDYLNHNVSSNQTSVSNAYLPNGNFKGRYNLLSGNAFPVNVYGAKIDYDDQLPAGIKLSAGMQSTYSTRNNTGIYSNQVNQNVLFNDSLSNQFKSHENINSAYISLKADYKRLSAQIGLRAENTIANANINTFKSSGTMLSFNYTDLFPTVYLSCKSGVNNTINLAIGKRISRPNYADLNPSVFFFDRYTSYKGNPLLQPAYAVNIEASYNYNSLFTVGVIYNTTSDQIIQAYTLINQAIVSNSYNLNRVINIGCYANPTVAFSKWLSLSAYLELNRANYQGTVDNGIAIANQLVSFRSSGSGQFKFTNGWSAEVSGLYRGKRTYGQGVYQPLWQLNSSVQKNLFNNKASLNLTARDIFHTNIINRTVMVQSVQLSRVITTDTQLVSLAFTYKFGTEGKSRINHNSLGNEANRAGAN